MAVDNALGQTFTNGQVTAGTAVLANGAYTYTGNTAFTAVSLLVGGESENSDGTTSLTFRYTADSSNPVIASVAGIPVESSAPTYAAPCYCPGTLIRTIRGDIAVEDLAVGDLLVTTSGEPQPVCWIGTRSYSGRFFSANPGVWPIRFRAGSLGQDTASAAIPSRDLLVSPKHAMLIDGVLVPAELLVNGRTIVRDGSAGTVSYFHVELPGHHAIWAENAASESFANDGSRGMFHNADTFAVMYPGAADEAPVFCAPRITEGEALNAICRRLNATEVSALAA